jgi:hypothetical protein
VSWSVNYNKTIIIYFLLIYRDGDVFALRREIEELRKALADQGGRQGKKSSKPLSEEVSTYLYIFHVLGENFIES